MPTLHRARPLPVHGEDAALIGPSGRGKSTLLRVFNRIYVLYPKLVATGELLLDGENILARHGVPEAVPFPMAIFGKVAYGIRHHERLSKTDMKDRVEQALRQAALRDEAKDRLGRSALVPLAASSSAVHCARGGVAARRAAARRAYVGAGPDIDEPHRAARRRARARLHRRDRDAQHAAGRAHFGLHRLHVPRRSGRARQHRDDLSNRSKRQTEDYITGRFG